ncbi:MAG: thioredoxin domain-containing protein [Patescibacteria group bacterium]
MYSENIPFVVPPSSQPKPKKPKSWYQRWWGRLIIVFFAIFFVLLTSISLYIGKVILLLKSGQMTPQELFGQSVATDEDKSFSTLITKDAPKLGPKDAKVIIVEFGDFECPACGKSYSVMQQVLKDYGTKVLFVFRNFPLINDHPRALPTAMAGQCAYEQGGFWEMYSRIYSNQDKIADTDLRNYALQIGLNMQQYDNCVGTSKYYNKIESDVQQGLEVGVEATPTFFINGVKIPGAIPLEAFEKIIVSELSR